MIFAPRSLLPVCASVTLPTYLPSSEAGREWLCNHAARITAAAPMNATTTGTVHADCDFLAVFVIPLLAKSLDLRAHLRTDQSIRKLSLTAERVVRELEPNVPG